MIILLLIINNTNTNNNHNNHNQLYLSRITQNSSNWKNWWPYVIAYLSVDRYIYRYKPSPIQNFYINSYNRIRRY